MAEDVASLAIVIQTQGAEQAAAQLGAVQASANRLGISVQQQAQKVAQAQPNLANYAQATQQVAAATQQAAQGYQKLQAANANVAATVKQTAIATQVATGSLLNNTQAANQNSQAHNTLTRSGLSQRAMWRLLARDAALFDSTLAGVLRTMGLLSISGSRLGTGVTLVAGAFFAAAGAAFYAAKAFIELQNAQVRLANALAFTKNASGQTVQGIEDISRRLSESGLISTKEVRDAALELLKFKDVTVSSFEDVLEISKRVASTGFVPMKEATGTLGKALSDLGNATDTLKGANLSLSEGTQLVIDQLLKQGKVFEAQKLLIDDLKKRTEGVESGTNTVSSAWGRWTDAIKNNAASLFAEFAQWSNLQDKMDKWTQNLRDQVKEREKLANLPALTLGGVRTAVGLPAQTPAEQKALDQKKVEQATLDVTRALLQQRDALGLNALELEVFNQTVAKGIPAYSEAAQKIREMVTAAMMTTEMKSTIDGLKQQVDQARIEAATVNMSAGAAAAYRAEQTAIFQLRLKGLEPGAKEIAQIREQTKALGGYTQAGQENKAELDARFKLQTVWLSETEKQIAEVQRSLHPEDWQDYMDSATANIMRITAALEEVKGAVTDLAKGLVTGMLQGKSAAEALDSALKNVAQTAASKAVEKLISGDFIGAGVSAVIAGGAMLLDKIVGNNKAQEAAAARQQELIKAQQEANAEWMNRMRLAAVNQNTLAGSLQAFDINAFQERMQAYSRGINDQTLLLAAQAAERSRIIRDFEKQAEDSLKSLEESLNPLSEIEQQMNSLRDVTAQMADVLKAGGKEADDFKDRIEAATAKIRASFEENLTNRLTEATGAYASPIAGVIKEVEALTKDANALGISLDVVDNYFKAVTASIKKTFEENLVAKINEATGRGYINQISDLLKEVNKLTKDAAALGVDPKLVSEYFRTQAQSIVNGAGLVGDSFSELIKLFPDLSSVVVESTEAVAAAKKQIEDLGKTIKEYLTGLQFGALSTLSPQAKLQAAQEEFDKTLAAAKTGNIQALTDITKVADTLLTAAKDFYASSAGYAAIYSSVTSGLGGLPGVSATPGYAQGGLVTGGRYDADSIRSMLAGGEYVTQATSVNSNTLPILEQINRTGSANDNRQNFVDLARTLSNGFERLERRLVAVEDAYRDGTQATQDTARLLVNRTTRPGEKAA